MVIYLPSGVGAAARTDSGTAGSCGRTPDRCRAGAAAGAANGPEVAVPPLTPAVGVAAGDAALT